MNILNYARQLELINYSNVNEDILNEADADPSKALEQVKSGKTAGSAYAPQWKQLTDSISTGIDAKKTAGSIIIKHDASAGGKDMVTVNWKFENGKVTLSVGAASTATAGPATQAIKDAAQKIWIALEGSSMTEDEEAVYAVFRDDIKTDADLQSLLAYWKSLKIPFVKGGMTNYDRTSLEKTSQVPQFKNDTNLDKWNYPLEYWLGNLFNASEINKVNDYLRVYSETRFKALS